MQHVPCGARDLSIGVRPDAYVTDPHLSMTVLEIYVYKVIFIYMIRFTLNTLRLLAHLRHKMRRRYTTAVAALPIFGGVLVTYHGRGAPDGGPASALIGDSYTLRFSTGRPHGVISTRNSRYPI